MSSPVRSVQPLGFDILSRILPLYYAAITSIVERNPGRWVSKKRDYWPLRVEIILVSAAVLHDVHLPKSTWLSRLKCWERARSEEAKGFRTSLANERANADTRRRELVLETSTVQFTVDALDHSNGHLDFKMLPQSPTSCVVHPRLFKANASASSISFITIEAMTAWTLSNRASYAIIERCSGSQIDSGVVLVCSTMAQDDVKRAVFHFDRLTPSLLSEMDLSEGLEIQITLPLTETSILMNEILSKMSPTVAVVQQIMVSLGLGRDIFHGTAASIDREPRPVEVQADRVYTQNVPWRVLTPSLMAQSTQESPTIYQSAGVALPVSNIGPSVGADGEIRNYFPDGGEQTVTGEIYMPPPSTAHRTAAPFGTIFNEALPAAPSLGTTDLEPPSSPYEDSRDASADNIEMAMALDPESPTLPTEVASLPLESQSTGWPGLSGSATPSSFGVYNEHCLNLEYSLRQSEALLSNCVDIPLQLWSEYPLLPVTSVSDASLQVLFQQANHLLSHAFAVHAKCMDLYHCHLQRAPYPPPPKPVLPSVRSVP